MAKLGWRSFVPKRYWRPSYFADRLRLLRWQRANPQAPWLAPESIAFIEQWLSPSDTVVEFGAGRSTTWFATRVKRVVSIEHHKDWFGRVASELSQANINNVDLILGSPASADYLKQLSDLDVRPTVVLVDGRDRSECAKWALENIEDDGLIIIDNVERYLASDSRGPESIGRDKPLSPEWEQFENAIRHNRQAWYDCGIWSTLVVFR